ncbi:MAG: hypothetical protein GY716_08875 [bacterium]|nr:hypothetical protein [bacterium]
MRPARVALPLLALLAGGCVAALREPPSLEELAGPGAPRDEPAAQRLAREAERAYDRRTPASVRRAADLWTRSARSRGGDVSALMEAVRAWAWVATHEPSEEARLEAAVNAVHAGQWCERLAPDDPRCDYWLAVGLGVQARERRRTAIDALPRIVERLETAIERVPELEHGGPDRVLALVLLRAPGWPTGPGDPDLGLEHARRAAELAPGYPPNQLCLAEALAAVEDDAASRAAYRAAADAARNWRVRGDPEAAEWLDEALLALPDE